MITLQTRSPLRLERAFPKPQTFLNYLMFTALAWLPIFTTYMPLAPV